MSELATLTATVRRAVSEHLQHTATSLAHRWPDAAAAAPEALTELADGVARSTRAGKRGRALLLAVGAGLRLPGSRPMSPTSHPVITAASALELYQASALVHDDIIDDADTRRSQPTAHRWLAQLHRSHGWLARPEVFGTNAAILLGDLLLSLAGEEMGAATSDPALGGGTAATARRLFDTMTSEVALGQYLDLRAEVTALPDPAAPESEHQAYALSATSHALDVVRHKSARYSVMYPLLIGASMAGTQPDTPAYEALAAFGQEVGIAFQLRDDELGTLGQEEVTGKPVGADLREGKRTVLVALAWQRATPPERRLLSEVLAHPEVTSDRIDQVCQLIRSTGAAQAHEQVIDSHLERARAHLERLRSAGLPDEDAELLGQVAQRLTHRRA